MYEKLKDRHNQIILFFSVFIFILFVRLFFLTIVEGDKYKKMADEIRIKKIPIAAPRGEIRDRYGRLLAGNKPSFTVQVMKNELIDEKINEVAIKLLNLLLNNGENYIDNFPIIIEKNRFYYTYDKEINDWLKEQGIHHVKNATEVFNILRERLEIDPDLNALDAQKEMQTKNGVYPPISVKTMKFIQQMQKENFLQKYHLKENLTAEQAFRSLRKKFKIPASYTNEDARKILILRNELMDQGYRQYQPVKVALDISPKTVAMIEEMNMDLPGVNVEIEPIRYYPNENLASHILGYLSKISDNEKQKYINELGYSPNDLIGKDGLERIYEKVLKGKDGAKYVEVDVYGRLMNVLKKEKPYQGDNIYLTIDSKLQKVAEDALKQALKQIQVGGTFESKWGNYNYSQSFRNATSGTVVALNAKTGEVLALANYPSFDPNLFATGISSEDWKALQDSNPRDPLSPLPLYNVAARAAVQPGSVFKMITGIAALEQGLDPNYKLYDDGCIKLGGKTFGCWIWNDSKRKHGWVDLYRALEVSCNYYFYNISTGWDHFKNKPLPIKMNVSKLLKYAKMFGLGETTGIEIDESAYGVPSPQKKLEAEKALLRRKLQSNAAEYFEKSVLHDKEKLQKQIEQIVNWADENPSRGTLIKRMGEMDIKEDKVESLAEMAKFDYYNQAKWSKGNTFNLSIGQGEHAYTPLQMARYIATIANDGYKNKVSVVKKVGNEELPNREEITKGERIPLKNLKHLQDIRKGMERVTQGDEGTGRRTFKSFPVKVVAKTGTAQRAGKIQPKNEADYIRKYYRSIAPGIGIDSIEVKAKELMKKNKDQYKDEGIAMREAIKILSKRKITDKNLDRFKPDYDNFAWFVSYAPAEDPQIVVVSLIYQGGHGGYASPIAREVIAEYMGLNQEEEYDKINLKNMLTN